MSIFFRQTSTPEKQSPSLKRSMSNMDMMEAVQSAFSMEGHKVEKLSVSVNNLSRLKTNNTNLINGFYFVRKSELQLPVSYVPGAHTV